VIEDDQSSLKVSKIDYENGQMICDYKNKVTGAEDRFKFKLGFYKTRYSYERNQASTDRLKNGHYAFGTDA
jgi:hypothetical protein